MLFVFGTGVTALHLKLLLALLGFVPGVSFLGYLFFPALGGLLGFGLARHARTLGRNRALAVLLLANPYSWLAGTLTVLALRGLLSPDAMGLGPAIGLFSAAFAALYLLWLWGMGWALTSPERALAYGAVTGLFLAWLPEFAAWSPLGVWGLPVGLALLALGWPRR